MPTIPVLPTTLPTSVTNSYEGATSSGSINVLRQQREQNFIQDTGIVNVPELQREQNPVYSATMTTGFNVPQSHVVTTPISLPGMPPITVSASLPQNTSLYPSVLQNQQNQFSPNISTTTVAPTLTPTLSSMQQNAHT